MNGKAITSCSQTGRIGLYFMQHPQELQTKNGGCFEEKWRVF
jgi:hypothetical protein